MWNRGKDNKNQFIGRRTGQNIIPDKKSVRKRDDGIEVFQDYWTDSEDDNTCLIAERHIAEPQVTSTVSEQITPDGKKNTRGKAQSSPCKTVVTDTIEIETKEVIYDSSNQNFAIQHKTKNFNQTITIQCVDDQNDDALLPDSSSPQNLNNTHTIPSSNTLQSDDNVFSTEPLSNMSDGFTSDTNGSDALLCKQNSENQVLSIDLPENTNYNEKTNDSAIHSTNSSVSNKKKRKAELETPSSNVIHENENLPSEPQNQSKKRLRVSLNNNNDVPQSPKKKNKKKKQPANAGLKVTGKENIKNSSEADTTGVRRSSRQRHAPLKFWSNERLQYRYTESGDIECKGVICDSKGDQLVYEKAFPKKKKVAAERSVKSHKPAQSANSFVEKGILVFDPESKEDVYANIVMPFSAIEWRSPKGKPSGKTFEVGKSYMLDTAAFGFLRLAPMQTKPMQYLPGYDAVFVVMSGKVEVCISRTSMLLSERDTFYLPRGNGYSVTNLLDSEALLNFMATQDSYLNELRKAE